MTDWLYIALRHSPPVWEPAFCLGYDRLVVHCLEAFTTGQMGKTKTHFIKQRKTKHMLSNKKTKTHFTEQKNKNTFYTTKKQKLILSNKRNKKTHFIEQKTHFIEQKTETHFTTQKQKTIYRTQKILNNKIKNTFYTTKNKN